MKTERGVRIGRGIRSGGAAQRLLGGVAPGDPAELKKKQFSSGECHCFLALKGFFDILRKAFGNLFVVLHSRMKNTTLPTFKCHPN